MFPLREPFSAWSHALGLVLAIPATWALWRRCVGQRGRQVSLLIYGLTLVLCYAGSATFHAVDADSQVVARLGRVDRVGIFLLIAGTYTPIAWNLLAGRLRLATLALAWSSAAAGSLLLLFHGLFPDWVTTTFYLAMGWGAVLILSQLTRAIGRRSVAPIVQGGVVYSVGAAIQVLRWPDPLPREFGYHGLFHLFVLAGSLCHFRFLMRAVASSPAAAPAAATAASPRPSIATPHSRRRPSIRLGKGGGGG